MKTEQRRFPRYQIPHDDLFVFSHTNHLNRMAVIRDISKRGIKIEYSPVSSQRPKWKLIDICAPNHKRLYLQAVSCKIVYDLRYLEENRTFSGSQCRMAGLQFRQLTKTQQAKLADLINAEKKKPKSE